MDPRQQIKIALFSCAGARLENQSEREHVAEVVYAKLVSAGIIKDEPPKTDRDDPTKKVKF